MTRRPLATSMTVLSIGVTLLAGSSAAPQVVFRSAVDSVALDVAVTTGNRPVAGLEAGDFEVTDNGVRQKILSVSHDTLPIDVTFVIDTSESVAGQLLNALIKAVEVVRRKLRPEDRVAVVTFSQRIRERLRLVPPLAASGLSIGPASGMTSLYDATVVALATPPVVDRRQMAIIFTDGDDTMSFLGGPRVLDVAGHSSTAVFAVAMAGPATFPGGFLDRIAETTGGILQVVDRFATSQTTSQGGTVTMTMTRNAGTVTLDASFLRALDEFRTSYVVRYQLEGVPRGGWHELSVKVTKGGRYTVRARKGYLG